MDEFWKEGVKIFVVGIGVFFDFIELKVIVSDFNNCFFYYVVDLLKRVVIVVVFFDIKVFLGNKCFRVNFG